MSLSVLFAGVAMFNYAQSNKRPAAQDQVAENMLLYQRLSGGWAKAVHGRKIVYDISLTEAQKYQIKQEKGLKDATIDNKATSREINYLVKAFDKTRDSAYLLSAQKGIDYLLKAQYDNGGWPQYYPDSSLYRSQVTFNDNAIVNVLNVLDNVVLQKNGYEWVDPKYQPRCATALQKGIGCILKTQIKVNGKRTGWNQQYNKNTLLPEKARSFELVGLASAESAAIVEFLMNQPRPGAAVKAAVTGAVDWLKSVAIEGYTVQKVEDPNEPGGGKNVVLKKTENSRIWARYYEIGTNRPFFCGRDGQKKYNLQEIETERRLGYSWYGSWPERIITKDYAKWLEQYGD
ncbi:pectate lyase, PelA/Pel-15E family [Arachidicoccus rhizosphaerae]|uniref:Pectate lyase, PelA/Pel-15E family n=2 Tax=Arachidicoccus rhizosphaerae TaxID=551991 RepID=A0A1H4ARL8_9BACT|nr:pectate lyase, PelA/Pel-15E family [Arachidicoccus rhizosphaerae]